MCRTSCVTRILALIITIAISSRHKYILFGAYVVHTTESREIKSEEFFDDNESFFAPVTLNPSFDDEVKQFIGITEEEEFFKKENDIFDKMRKDEAFFFRKEQNEKSGKKASKETDVVSQHSRVCNCEGVYCGCCSAIRVLGKERFRGCVQIEYVPGDFAMFMTLSINGHTVITRVLSGRNPLPFCAKTPYVPLVSFCIRLYDIHHNPHGVSLCVRLEATSMRQILFSISFDCIKIDNNKISFMMPPNATTFGVVGLHLGDTDPYLSYQDWTKLHWPLPDVLPPTTQPHPLAHQHHFLWLNWK